MHDIRFMSYNVHGFVDMHDQYSPEKTLAVLSDINADVIALQEVLTDDRDGLTLLKQFANNHSYKLIFGPTILHQHGHHYGNAMLTKGKIKSTHLHDISVPGREPRSVLHINVFMHQEYWHILTTHLGLKNKERRYQIKRLQNIINTFEQSPIVLMGDINEWFPWTRNMRKLKRLFQQKNSPATFPSKWPLFSLDKIFILPAFRMDKLYTSRSNHARIASDHLPLIADIALPTYKAVCF